MFHFSLFLGFFSLSLTLSLIAHQIRLAIRNDPNTEPIRNILTLNSFATIPFGKPIRNDPHSRRSRRIIRCCCQIVHHTRRFCLLIVTFACHRRFYRRCFCSLWSPIKPQQHFGSLPHRHLSFLLLIQLPQPFNFHPHRLFTFPSPLQTPTTLRLPLQLVTFRLPFKLFFFLPNYLKYETPKIIFIYCFSFLVSELIKIPCFAANL